MMKKYFFVLVLSVSLNFQAQIGINIAEPHLKSVLDVVSKNNNTGVLFPRLTTTQRNAINPSTIDPTVDNLKSHFV